MTYTGFSPRALEKGTNLYHFSNDVDTLVTVGIFDGNRSRHEGRAFFALQPTLRTNCVVTVRKPLELMSIEASNGKIPNSAVTSDFMRAWHFWEAAGYDGQIGVTADPYCRFETGDCCDEVMLFAHALHKLGRFALI